MALTEIKLRAMLANPQPGKTADKDGLFMRTDKAGRMYWRSRLRRDGRDTEQSYGPYPEVTLAQAREAHREARSLLRQGINPIEARRRHRAAMRAEALAAVPFEAVAREWFSVRKDEWAPGYADKVIRRLETDVFPYIGPMPIATLTPPEVLAVLRRIEGRGVLETAHRALVNIGQVCRHAVASGRAVSDPTRDLRGALKRPLTKHFAAITDPEHVGSLMRAIEGYAGTAVVRAALRLAPMLIVRPGELRFTRWEEVDLERATLTISPRRMKRTQQGKLTGNPHIVPLPKQAVAILSDLKLLTGRNGGMVFPGERDHERAMSENTVNAALRRMGYDTQKEMTGHGFRAMARTILDEKLGFEPAIIEAQLAHAVKDALGRAYNRTQHLQKRVEMMQAWADYLEALRAAAPPASTRATAVADDAMTACNSPTLEAVA